MPKLKYLSGTSFMLKLSLLYPIDTTSKFRKSLYFIWGLLYAASFITTFIQCAVYLYRAPFNLIEESMVIMNTVIYFSLIVNFTFLFFKREKLFEFVNNINKNFVDETDNKLDTIKMDRVSNYSDKFAYYWPLSAVIITLMPAITSFIGGNRMLPIIAWIPYNVEKSPVFEFTYIWQVFCLINLGTIYGVLDMVFPCIALIMSQQFKILSNNFKNNIYRALLESNVEKQIVQDFRKNLENNEHEDIFQALTTRKFRQENVSYLKKNIRHHQLLLNYYEDMNDILSMFLMGKISAAIFNTLFMFFCLITVITTRNQALIYGLAVYVMSTTSELFMYTYSGQILSQSVDFMWTLYESLWYLCDLQFQKIFLILQMRVSKMMYTKAGNYFSMSAPSFITFMKALGSYVALLKELTERER